MCTADLSRHSPRTPAQERDLTRGALWEGTLGSPKTTQAEFCDQKAQGEGQGNYGQQRVRVGDK